MNIDNSSKIRMLLGFVLAGMLIMPQVFAGDLEPSAPPGSTMKTLDEVEPRKPISQADIPLTISESGSYYLTEDINSADTAITVEVNNVTIDLMGYSLSGHGVTDTYGIYMKERSNVEIRNGTARNFYNGIYGTNTSGDVRSHRVVGVRAVFNVNNGIYLCGSGNLVEDCTASDNGRSASGAVYGIFVGNGSTVTGNTLYGNGYQASNVYGLKANTGSTVRGNTVFENGNSATGASVMGIITMEACTINGNTVCWNGHKATSTNIYGIRAYHASTVSGNAVSSNGVVKSSTGTIYGIYAGLGCTVTCNTASRNGISSAADDVYGIYLSGNNLADQNTAVDNEFNISGTGINLFIAGTCTLGTNHAP